MDEIKSTPESTWFKGVLVWDLDGTIIDSLRAKGEAFASIFGEYPDKRSEIVAFHYANGGTPRYEKIQRIAEQVIGRRLTYQETLDRMNRFSDVMASELCQVPLVEGAVETLDRLSRGFDMYVVTAMPWHEAEQLLAFHKLRHHFRGVFGHPKTKHEAIKRILSRHKFSSFLISIGDSQEDASLAQEFSMTFVQVRLDSTPISDSGAQLVLSTLSGADEKIESLIAGLRDSPR